MPVARKKWSTPELQVFGNMQTLTLQGNSNPGPGSGGGTGNTDSGECSGKGCGNTDTLQNQNANSLTGWSSV